jgi:hypothetical protein
MKLKAALLTLIVSILLLPQLSAQALWQIQPSMTEVLAVGGDTSRNHLVSLMQSGDVFDMYPAAVLLAYYHGTEEKDLILQKLAPMGDRSNASFGTFSWFMYYQYQEIRGYLGDGGAIASLDTLVQMTPTDQTRLEAIRLLAEAGHLDYLPIILDAVPNQSLRSVTMQCLAVYGKESSLRNQVESALVSLISDTSEASAEVMIALNVLAKFDSSRAATLLNDAFLRSHGMDRSLYFVQLDLADPDGQPERTMLGISTETDQSLRNLYFPPLLALIHGGVSNRYLSPMFVKFSQGLVSDEAHSRFLAGTAYEFIKEFVPPAPAKAVLAVAIIDSLVSYERQAVSYGWLSGQVFADDLNGMLSNARSRLLSNDLANCSEYLRHFQLAVDDAYKDSLHQNNRSLTIEGWKFLYYNAQYAIDRLASAPSGLLVNLVSSTDTKITNGSLQYYEGSWKDAVNNNDGTFNVNTTLTTVSLRMTYAYGSQQKNNVAVNGGPVVFQTVNTQVKLQNSQGTLTDTGSVQYYAGAWRDFGVTTNGVATMELLPASYSFRMTYAYGNNDKQQDIGANPVVVFQTVNAAVQLKNSQGILMDAGTVQYYAGAWRDFGSTTNGVVTKELLPNNYSFRMTYAFASKDMQQNIGTNPTVVFSTVNATVQLKNSLGNLIDAGTVQYYAGAWRDFGTTTNGVAAKELLGINYSFRMTYEYVSNDIAQDIGTNSTVGFSTVLCTVRVSNTLGQMLSGAMVTYYAGAWRQIGTTVNGQITKELLPANLSFRASYGGRSQDKAQNLSTNATIEVVLP